MFDDLQAETYRVDFQGKNLSSAKKDLELYKAGATITQAYYRTLLEQHSLEPLLVKFEFIPAQNDSTLSIHQHSAQLFSMMQNKTSSKPQAEQAKPCYLLPNDQRLIFISAIEPNQFKVECSICYKNIIEISSQESGKFAQISPKQLQLKYIKDFEQYQRYIIAKWRILDEYNQQ